MNYALVKDGEVVNVIVTSAEFAASLEGYDEVLDVTDTAVSKGWGRENGEWIAPPQPEQDVSGLIVDKTEIQADNTDEVVAKYHTTNETRVTFLVDDEVHRVDVVDGVAILEVTADAVGPFVIECGGQTKRVIAYEPEGAA